MAIIYREYKEVVLKFQKASTALNAKAKLCVKMSFGLKVIITVSAYLHIKPFCHMIFVYLNNIYSVSYKKTNFYSLNYLNLPTTLVSACVKAFLIGAVMSLTFWSLRDL